MIKKFTIFGERCSGTNFLMHAMEKNFEITFTAEYVWKHFFGHYDFNKLSDEENEETLFIGIIRDPVEWIDSFYKKMHHIPPENKNNINSFLFNEFYSINPNNEEIMDDRHIITKNRYKNIFELRSIKNDYLINTMKNKVKNYILIRYEDLRDKYQMVLSFLENKFKLIKQNKDIKEYITIDNYKGFNNKIYYRKKIELSKNIIQIIKKNVDKNQENSLGYII